MARISVDDEVFFLSSPVTPIGALHSAAAFRGSAGVGREGWRVYGSYALVVVVRGRGVYRDARGLSEPIAQGQAIVVFPELPHAYHAVGAPAWDEMYVAFSGPQFDLLRQAGVLDWDYPVLPELPAPGLERLVAFCRRPRAFTPQAAVSEVLEFAALLSELCAARVRTRPLTWAERAKSELEERLGSREAVREAAAAMDLSFEGFRKRFRREAGISPQRHVAEHRLLAARALLTESQIPLRTLAESLGFSDEYHLSKAFRARFGEPPGRYRKAVG